MDKTLISGLFETVRVSAVSKYPIIFQIFKKSKKDQKKKRSKKFEEKNKKKTSRYRLAADKMCLSGIYYLEF
jgi:hypothetical protein